MATATGDYALDFRVMADANPYAPTGFTAITGSGQILGSYLRSTTAGAAYELRYDGVVSNSDITRVTFEVGFPNAAAPNGTVFLELTTADGANGFKWVLGSASSYLYVVTAGTGAELGRPSTGGFLSGTTFSLEYQKSTGRVELFRSGVSLFSNTNTAHDTKTLTFAYGLQPASGSTIEGIASVASTGMPTATGADYTQRKGSTLTATHTLGTITTATLNAVNVFDHVSSQAAGTVSFTGAVTDEIATSGEYNLVLGDGTGTETYTVQVNVVGLASYNINKDGADQASLADVEFIVMTGAAGSRVIAEQITGVTTDVSGNTGAIEITDVSMNADDVVTILQQSATVGGGLPHSATLVAL